MQIRTRMCISIDGYVTTPDGRPAQLVDPNFGPGNYGFVEFQQTCDAVLMGRTTFEPATGAERWPWADLDVFVLGSHRPAGTPDFVTVDSDPKQLVDKIRATNRGGDVHLVGGPRTIETFRSLGALDKLGLIVLPLERDSSGHTWTDSHMPRCRHTSPSHVFSSSAMVRSYGPMASNAARRSSWESLT